jgi:hypothetical protein
MAYINATLWNDIQVTDATNEKRFSQLGIIDAVKDSTAFVDYIPPSAIEAMSMASSLRDVQIPVLKDQTVTVVTTPGFQYIPANLPESDQYTFQAYDVFSGFRHYPATYANNSVDSDWARMNVMKNVAYAIGNRIETILSTVIETRKTQQLGYTTQVSQGDGTYSFSTSTDTLTISKAAQKETMFFYMEELMRANEVGGGYRFVGNRGAFATQRAEYLKYGVGQSKDLQALSVFPLDRLYESGNISAGSDVFSGYALRDGSMGIYENFPYDFRNGTEIAGKKWTITDMELPFCRLRANIYTNSEATDATALISSGTDSNAIMTHFEEMAIWVRFYVVYRYNSDIANRVNDIVKIVGATS